VLTQERLKEVLKYHQRSGRFVWLISPSRNVASGSVAGYVNKSGYRYITIKGKDYPAHQLAFLYVEGFTPENEIDHMDGYRCNNRWSNLREVSHSCNLQNQKIHKNNKSGFRGVHRRGNYWVATIKIMNKGIYIGSFHDKTEAALARITVEENCPHWRCDSREEGRIKIQSALDLGH